MVVGACIQGSLRLVICACECCRRNTEDKHAEGAAALSAAGASEEVRLLLRIGVKGPASVVLPRRDDPAWVAENIIPADLR